jgi:hypothetical protein
MKLIILLLFVTTSVFGQSKIDVAKKLQKKYNPPNKNYVVFIDYSKSISEKRLYVIDMNTSEIILTTEVAHGINSGKEYATDFSNNENTLKSSLGVYITQETYYGQFGFSLRVNGLDSTNSNARHRKIIFHSNKKMHSKWSFGCFATPEEINSKLINLIKNGCLVFVFKHQTLHKF